MNPTRALLLLSAALAAAPAAAQEKREYCPDRPGVNTPPCTIEPGRASIEVGLADWTLAKQPDSRTDTVLTGDLSLRFGIGESTEARIGWTAYGHIRTRGRGTGLVEKQGRVGDVTIGIKQNLRQPDGSGFSVALLPYATLPVGREPVGAGDWGGGLLAPISYELSEGVKLAATPEVDAQVDEDGSGRHLQYGSAIGLSDDLTDKLNLTAELQALRDRDPGGHETQALAALSLAWQPKEGTQFDVGSTVGLNRATPDVELFVGVARKF